MLVAPREFELVEVPVPDPEQLAVGEVLVRTLAGGVCGSDLPNYRGHRQLSAMTEGWDGLAARLPGYPLHEIVGEVVASRDEGIEVGSQVVGWATRVNGLAEYVVTRADSVHRFDPRLPAHEAVMLQPLACAISASERIGDVSGARVAVLGQGPIGVLFSHILSTKGAEVVAVDAVNRRDVAPAFGVHEFVHATTGRWAASLREEERPDVVVEAIGHQVSTLTQAIDVVRPEGRILYFGVPDDPVYPLPMNGLMRKNLTLKGCVVLDRARVLRAADEYLGRYPELAKAYVTDVVPMKEAQHGFELAINPKPGQLKVVLSAE